MILSNDFNGRSDRKPTVYGKNTVRANSLFLLLLLIPSSSTQVCCLFLVHSVDEANRHSRAMFHRTWFRGEGKRLKQQGRKNRRVRGLVYYTMPELELQSSGEVQTGRSRHASTQTRDHIILLLLQ